LASFSFLEQAFVPDWQMESPLESEIRMVSESENLSCVSTYSWAWRLAMDSEKLSFDSAKSPATELVSLSSSGVYDSVLATARKLF